MRFVTWNVNSLLARMPRVLELLQRHRPDVVCLQETRTAAAGFPHLEFGAAGYAAVEHGAGRWAGVAILAPTSTPPTEVVRGLDGEPDPREGRWIEATVGGARVASAYVINGRSPDHPVFADKLTFLDAVSRRIRRLAGRAPLAVLGDFNVAPSDLDVYDPTAFVGGTHVSAEERSRLAAILDAGVVDAYRHLEPGGAQYTWWDYRAGHFHRDLGMRIDLALLSPDLVARCEDCRIDRDFRKGNRPSDHAPLLVDLA